MKKILLIWDIDGTLIDSKGCGRRAMDRTFMKLYNIEDGFKTVNMAGRLDWKIVKDALEINKVSQENIFDFLNNYGSILKEELKNDSLCKVLPGIEEIFQNTFEDKDIYHVIGTGNCEIGAKLKLSHLGLDKYFEIGGFGDEDMERWELIGLIMDKAIDYYNVDFKKNDVYVIGDTPSDIECGKKLGINSVAVATGRHKYNELEKYNPDYIFQSLSAFEDFISLIKKGKDR